MNLFEEDESDVNSSSSGGECVSFHLVFGGGTTFKSLVDFLAVAFPITDKSSCDSWLSVSNTCVTVSEKIEDRDDIRTFLSLTIDGSNLHAYPITKTIRINLSPKKLHVLGRTVKKIDEVHLIYENGNLDLRIETPEDDKVEIKRVPIKTAFVCEQPGLVDDLVFAPLPAREIKSSEIQSLKKAIGCTRDEIVRIHLAQSSLIFEYLAGGDSPSSKRFGEVITGIPLTSVAVSGIFVNVLAKLTPLTPALAFFNNPTDDRILRVHADIATGSVTGCVKVTVKNTNK